jgi:hypothetical protein
LHKKPKPIKAPAHACVPVQEGEIIHKEEEEKKKKLFLFLLSGSGLHTISR